jgi:hypothetical protein
MKKLMDDAQIIVATTITVVCSAGIITQQLWKSIIIDEKTFFLLVLGMLPWLPVLFKKFKVGGFEAVARDRSQSNTDTPIPSALQPSGGPVQQVEISADGKKILATLWRYQTMHFKDDYSKRWTFSIFPTSSEYIKYMTGLAELLGNGLVTVSSETNQAMLTNEGIVYLRGHTELQSFSDIYIF